MIDRNGRKRRQVGGGAGVTVRPLDVTSSLLFPKWTYGPGEEDLTVMRVLADGVTGGKRRRVAWDLLDFYNTQERCTSMARTTGFPCTIVARMIAEGKFKSPGVNPPERIAGQRGAVETILAALQAKGVHFRMSWRDL